MESRTAHATRLGFRSSNPQRVGIGETLGGATSAVASHDSRICHMARLRKPRIPERKRSLRIVLSRREASLVGECTRCSRRFKAQKESDRNDVVGQYEAHLCASEDVRRTGKKIINRAGVTFLFS